jgi:addiction module RelE/StbE family toxin
MNRFFVVISPSAKKDIDRLQPRMKERIGRIINDILSTNPYLGKTLKAQMRGLYSYRAGDYRIIYAIIRNKLVIHILQVAHRREAYR